MPFSAYALKLLALSQTLHRWLSILTGLDRANRERIADYAEQIAGTLGRAAHALERSSSSPLDSSARTVALRELGRIAGYVETIVSVLEQHLDGRKLAGVKRRLEALDVERFVGTLDKGRRTDGPLGLTSSGGLKRAELERLAAAEGYFRALADGLRA